MNQHVNNVTYIGWVLEVCRNLTSLHIYIYACMPHACLCVHIFIQFLLMTLNFGRCFTQRELNLFYWVEIVRVWQSMPQEVIDTHELRSITLDYRRECQRGDVVDSLTSPEPMEDTTAAVSDLKGTNGSATSKDGQESCQFLHLLRLSGDGLEINRGRTDWRKKPEKKLWEIKIWVCTSFYCISDLVGSLSRYIYTCMYCSFFLLCFSLCCFWGALLRLYFAWDLIWSLC